MKRALDLFAFAALLTLAVGAAGADHQVAALVTGALYVAFATVGFAWVEHRRRLVLSIAYVLFQMVLGYVVFVLSGATVGAVLLLLVLVSQSVLLLPVPAAVVVVAHVPFVHLGMEWRDGLREGLGMLAASIFTAAVTYLLMREQEARQELALAHERLREYALQAERLAAAQERNRVARDIHDGLGHSLTVVQMQIKAARAVLDRDPAKADTVLVKAQRQAEEALAEVRRSVGALREARRPGLSDLSEALRALADETSAAGVPTSVDVSGEARPLPADAAESLFRAAQEGLTNVRKHARATRAELLLDYTRPAAVRLQVRDDGAGIAAPHGSGYGLLGVRERAAHAGGQLTIESAPGRGSTLTVEVPG